jgi:hypothetical protein
VKKEIKLKRKEPCFWLEHRCPFCNHFAPPVYIPDLLKGPIDFECYSKYNNFRKNNVCYGKWSVAVDEIRKNEIKNLIKIAEEQDELYKKISINRKILGFKN